MSAVIQDEYTQQNNSTVLYSFTFPYLKASDVKASINGVQTTAFTLPNATQIQLNSVPAQNTKIRIFRETSVDDLTATFYAGSAIKSEDLNDNFTQNLYKTQEVGTRSISNLGGTMAGNLNFGTQAQIVFEGATDDAHETTLAVTDPTADRTITLPNVTGTVVTTGDTGTVATGMIAADAINGTKIADDSINSEHYVDGSIDTAHIADSQITTAKIANSNVTTAKIADANVTTAKIAADAINGTKIADDSINSEHYVDASIDTAHIADAQITTAKIADDAVTAAKIANTSVTAGSYTAADITVDAQGRITAASSGVIGTNEITDSAVTTAKLGADSVTGAKIADDAVDSEHLAADSIDTEHYAAGSVDTTALGADAVTGAKIADDTINSEHYAAGSIDTEHIADSQITSAKIADGTIVAGDLASNSVTTVKITDANVTTAKIADSNITTAKIADSNVTTAKIAADNITNALIADDQIDSEHYVDGSIDTAHIGNTQVTDAKLASNAVTTSKITDANVTTAKIANDAITIGKIGCEQTTISDSDSHIPTSGAVVDYVAAQIAPIGGLEVIATEVAFPNTQPAAGVVISIADAGGIVVNGSGTSTTGRTVGGSTVTINNINSAFNSSTVDAGISFMVSSTGSGQVYNFHKATLKEADILNLSNDINDFANRYRVGSSNPTSSLDNGDLFFNTGTGKMLVYNGTNTAWEEVQSIGNFFISTLSPAFDGSTQDFTITNAPTNVQQIILSINGVIQKPNAGTSTPSEGFALSGSTVKLAAAPPTGSTYFAVVMGSTVNIGTPSDGTVSAAKIASGAVTTAKIADDAVTHDQLANHSVDLDKFIHGTSSENGKFLRANNGTHPTFETVNTDLVSDTSPQLGGTLDTNGNLISFPDSGGVNSNRLKIGSGNDIEIFHVSDNSYFDFPTGYNTYFRTGTNRDTAILIKPDNAVELYYDNSKKFETTTNGVTITGNQNFADNGYAYFGAGNDMGLYSDGSGGFIKSDDLTIGTFTGGEKYIDATLNGAVELYYDNSKKFETTSGGAIVSGRLDTQGLFTGDDNKILIGNSDDLQIFHDGSNSYVRETGTGDLYIECDSKIYIGKASGGAENGIVYNVDGSVDLYYDNSKKLETTSGGVSVTGGINLSTNLSMVDNGVLKLGTHDDLRMVHNGSHSYIEHFGTGDLYFGTTNNAPNADIMLITNSSVRWQVQDSGHLKPAANNTYDIGTTSNRVRNIYTNDLHLSNEGSSNDVDGSWGDWTIQEGESDLFLKNNRSGKKYKFNLTEVS